MDWIPALIITAVLTVVFIVGYMVYHFYKKAKNSTSDKKNKASTALLSANTFAKLHQYSVITPANIAKDGRFADIDFLIIGYFGVLGVKCFGQGGEIYGNAGDAMWLQVASEKRTPFNNPLITAQTDARVVRDTLFAAGLKSVPVEVICVFTNPKVTLALPRSTGHFTMKDYKAYLQKPKFEQDKNIDIALVKSAIEKWVTKTK